MWVFIVILLFILGFVLRQPIVKGWIGEKGLAIRLRKLDPGSYKVLNDITLPSSNGKTTQIDHIILSKFGLFVIETKNYAGWIMGSEFNEYWTQVIYKRKERLYNPIRQNYSHIKSLVAIIGEHYEKHMIPIVCFSNRATLKVKVEKSNVIYSTGIIKVIKKYQTPRLEKAELMNIEQKINEQLINGKGSKKTHIDNINNSLIDKELMVANNVCPKCKGELVVRQGKHGRFKGCKNYPSCKFTYNLQS